MEHLELIVEDRIARLIINRPEKRNALTSQMWNELARMVDQLQSDKRVRVLMVESSTPGVFSAGADIGEYRENAGNQEWGLASQDRVSNALKILRAFPHPTLAIVDGPCFGGGAGIAISCDFRIATNRSSFAITPTKLGMVYPYEEMVHLLDVLSVSVVKQILYTGVPFDADWAQKVGFVDFVVSTEQLELQVSKFSQLLLDVSKDAISRTKYLIGRIQSGHRHEDSQVREIIAATLLSDDHQEGLQAFLENRSPKFD